jgi:phospholipid transport system substrate-binding protein
MNFKKLFIFAIFLINLSTLALSVEPKQFVQITIDKASKILSSNSSNTKKIKDLKHLALEVVDLEGVGMYALGKHRKQLSDEQKKIYISKYEKYFLKIFSNRLIEWSNPKIIINSQEKLNDNYTMVNTTLGATDKTPELKIDWRIYTKFIDKPLVRDVSIEGLSLGRTQKEEFASIIRSNDGDINALFKKLDEVIAN